MVNPSHIARDLVRAVLDAADPARAVDRAWTPDLDRPDRVVLIAYGKASVTMADAAARRLGTRLARGVVVGVPERLRAYAPPPGVEALPADHPLPTDRNVRAGEALEPLARSVGPAETALVLVSGGGSAQLTLPAGALTLEDIRTTTDALLRAGATIDELNTVRKHLDRLKGGHLAAMLGAADRVEALVLSDVLGDRLDVISSGPTAPDPTTYADALAVLASRGVPAPVPVLAHLEAGVRADHPETPKPGDRAVERVRHTVIANNAGAVRAGEAFCASMGYEVRARTGITGEAADHGWDLADELAGVAEGTAIVMGGETTVEVGSASGLGGRNQELALAAALGIEGHPGSVVIAFGTDGIDGPTDAAGAAVDGRTADAIRDAGVDPDRSLRNHDSFPALGVAGALIRTGPTGTNVNDIVVGLRVPSV
ncbi:MAG: DUF4147 domain-containing protein [Phycisphaerales bacterium]